MVILARLLHRYGGRTVQVLLLGAVSIGGRLEGMFWGAVLDGRREVFRGLSLAEELRQCGCRVA